MAHNDYLFAKRKAAAWGSGLSDELQLLNPAETISRDSP